MVTSRCLARTSKKRKSRLSGGCECSAVVRKEQVREISQGQAQLSCQIERINMNMNSINGQLKVKKNRREKVGDEPSQRRGRYQIQEVCI